ncbi:MAG: hypothetical protein HY207_02935 [Nitrospirae bacterium]|nr:hypothetical protein [Nitrospirota bacterium]
MEMRHTTRTMIERLLFIYAADSGKWGAFVDSAKKLFMLNGCALCSITHGLAGEKSAWRDCKEELGVPIDYVHRDELTQQLKVLVGDSLPCIVAQTRLGPMLLVRPEVLERCRGSVADLKGKILYYAGIKDLDLAA